MFQGNWTCSKCGGPITELPFQPRSEEGLTCRNCYMASKNGGQQQSAPSQPPADEAPPFDPDMGSVADEPAPPPPDDLDGAVPSTGERKMFQGDWSCSVCGASITQLPFEPRGDASNLKCIDCFKNSKG